MNGVESIDCEHEFDQSHIHLDGDKCHRCNSTNTETKTDAVPGLMYWGYLHCNDCKLGMVFTGSPID